uniref:Uncharacterized protein n=1 Tax=Arundo donax TaxID=35708 RepID=A0A0A8Y5Y4_ARUDO
MTAHVEGWRPLVVGAILWLHTKLLASSLVMEFSMEP